MCLDKIRQFCFSSTANNDITDTHPPFRSLSSDDLLPEETRKFESLMVTRSSHVKMAQELKYFFMNPCQKYQAKKRKPYKLLIQIIKIAIVTTQLILYGTVNQDFTVYKNSNKDVIQKMVFENIHNESRIFEKENLYSYINSYVEMPTKSIGFYTIRPIPENTTTASDFTSSSSQCNATVQIQLCIEGFNKNPKTQYHQLTSTYRVCHIMREWTSDDVISSQHIPLCNGSNIAIDFIGLRQMEINFIYRTRWLEDGSNHYHGRCFDINSKMTLTNHAHSGLVVEMFTIDFYLKTCESAEQIELRGEAGLISLDILIIIFCLSSTVLCSRSLYRSNRLRIVKEVKQENTLKTRIANPSLNDIGKNWVCLLSNSVINCVIREVLSTEVRESVGFWDKFEFVNLWHFLIVVSDLLTIVGTCIKLDVTYFLKEGNLIDLSACSIFLGLGCLCIWVGVLRYVGYFHQYNKLVLTMKIAMPHVLRFMVCASILYFGFMFCGWLVLGPYHHKFRSLVVTSEALFSLINGDDMYMTYEDMPKTNGYAWAFSQVYLYTFISLFIYIVLSLFIAVITDIYEMIKVFVLFCNKIDDENGHSEWQEKGKPPRTKVEQVLEEMCGTTHDQFDDFLHSDTYCFFCCYHNNDPDIDSDSEAFYPIQTSATIVNGDVTNNVDDDVTSEISFRHHSRSMTS